MSFKRKILSIDGGGIRGIIPATVLDYIEQKKGKPISQIFDLIAGTSTGGILSLTLTKPGADGLPQFTAKDIIALYRDQGAEIFHERFPGPFDDLIQAKYGSENREKVLSDYFGNTLLNAALTDLFITSYDIELRIPVFFVSKPEAQVNAQYYEKICGNYTMLQAAMATSAAPTFFPPYQIPKLRPLDKIFQDATNEKESPQYALIDGGAFANNPASLALMEAMITYQHDTNEELARQDVLVVSLGTGSLTRSYKYAQSKNWGQLKWMLPFINIVFDAQSEAVACQLDQLLIHKLSQKQYFRYQEFLTEANDDMDDASPENIQELEKLAAQLIEKNQDDLDQLCDLL